MTRVLCTQDSRGREIIFKISDLILVRLKGGNRPNEGFIEIKGSTFSTSDLEPQTWGGICDDRLGGIQQLRGQNFAIF